MLWLQKFPYRAFSWCMIRVSEILVVWRGLVLAYLILASLLVLNPVCLSLSEPKPAWVLIFFKTLDLQWCCRHQMLLSFWRAVNHDGLRKAPQKTWLNETAASSDTCGGLYFYIKPPVYQAGEAVLKSSTCRHQFSPAASQTHKISAEYCACISSGH